MICKNCQFCTKKECFLHEERIINKRKENSCPDKKGDLLKMQDKQYKPFEK